MKSIRISPSEIAYLYDRCKRCWYRKVNGLQKPKESLPQIFRHVDAGMKVAVPDLCAEFGIPIQSACSFEKVVSAPFVFESYGVQIVVSGKVDKAVLLEDGTYGIIELKMSEPSAANVNKFKPQIMAYESALRRPAQGTPHEVSRLDLFFMEPVEGGVKTKRVPDGRVMFSLTGQVTHIPVEIDRNWFEASILEPMAKVAGSLELPEPGEYCEFCSAINATCMYDSRLSALAGSGGKK